MSVKMIDDMYVAHTYGRFPITLVKGEGCTLYDEQGKAYIDMTSGIGVNSLGHQHPAWMEAIKAQLNELAHVSNLYYTKPCAELAQTLCQRSHFKKVLFQNSGAEANEAAIKAARKYSYDKYGLNRNEIITLKNSFHGRTLTTLSATGQDHFHQFFYPFTEGFQYVEANHIEALQNCITNQTCAIMMEMIQGEGGVLPLEYEYVQQLAKICKEKDILMIVDEVQTGIGRCGTLFAYEQFDIQPDIVTLAKGLGGGLPIGAVLFNENTEEVFTPGTHGSTFGGNPIACAGANAVLAQMDDNFLAAVKAKGEYIKERILKMNHVQKVNGLGLMRGIVLDGIAVGDVVKACMEQGLLVLTAKDKLRLLPPLTISMEELAKAMDILESILA